MDEVRRLEGRSVRDSWNVPARLTDKERARELPALMGIEERNGSLFGSAFRWASANPVNRHYLSFRKRMRPFEVRDECAILARISVSRGLYPEGVPRGEVLCRRSCWNIRFDFARVNSLKRGSCASRKERVESRCYEVVEVDPEVAVGAERREHALLPR